MNTAHIYEHKMSTKTKEPITDELLDMYVDALNAIRGDADVVRIVVTAVVANFSEKQIADLADEIIDCIASKKLNTAHDATILALKNLATGTNVNYC